MAVLSKCVVGSSLVQIALGAERTNVDKFTNFTPKMYNEIKTNGDLQDDDGNDMDEKSFQSLFALSSDGKKVEMQDPKENVGVCMAISTLKDKKVQSKNDKGGFEMDFKSLRIPIHNEKAVLLAAYFEECRFIHLEKETGFQKDDIQALLDHSKEPSTKTYKWDMNSFLNVNKFKACDQTKFQTLAGQDRDTVTNVAKAALNGFEKKDLEDCDSEFFALIADDSLEAFQTTGDDTKKISLLKDCFEVMKNKKIKEQAKNDDPKKKDGEEDEEKANPKEVVDTNDIAQPLKDLNDKLPSTWEKRGLWVLLGSSAFTSMATLLIQLHKDHVKAKVDVDEDDEESSDESSD